MFTTQLWTTSEDALPSRQPSKTNICNYQWKSHDNPLQDALNLLESSTQPCLGCQIPKKSKCNIKLLLSDISEPHWSSLSSHRTQLSSLMFSSLVLPTDNSLKPPYSQNTLILPCLFPLPYLLEFNLNLFSTTSISISLLFSSLSSNTKSINIK